MLTCLLADFVTIAFLRSTHLPNILYNDRRIPTLSTLGMQTEAIISNVAFAVLGVHGQPGEIVSKEYASLFNYAPSASIRTTDLLPGSLVRSRYIVVNEIVSFGDVPLSDERRIPPLCYFNRSCPVANCISSETRLMRLRVIPNRLLARPPRALIES
jgi:hypothetical protein